MNPSIEETSPYIDETTPSRTDPAEGEYPSEQLNTDAAVQEPKVSDNNDQNNDEKSEGNNQDTSEITREENNDVVPNFGSDDLDSSYNQEPSYIPEDYVESTDPDPDIQSTPDQVLHDSTDRENYSGLYATFFAIDDMHKNEAADAFNDELPAINNENVTQLVPVDSQNATQTNTNQINREESPSHSILNPSDFSEGNATNNTPPGPFVPSQDSTDNPQSDVPNSGPSSGVTFLIIFMSVLSVIVLMVGSFRVYQRRKRLNRRRNMPANSI